MNNFIPEISLVEALFNPWVTILWLLILWLVIYLIFRLFKVSDRTLKRLEIVYLLVGFLGVLGVVVENRKERLLYEQEYLRTNIQKELTLLDMDQYEFPADQNGCLIDRDSRDVERLNNLLQKYRKNEAKIKSDSTPFNIIGTLLLLIAVALRLAITSYNLKKMKKR